jgi:hypothetical protein
MVQSCKMLVKPVAVVKSVAADLADKLGRQAATSDWRLIYFCNIVLQWRANLCPAICVSMSHKKEIEESLDTEKAKELELDETPKPTRKVSRPSVPVPDSAEPSTHDRIKGRRVIK